MAQAPAVGFESIRWQGADERAYKLELTSKAAMAGQATGFQLDIQGILHVRALVQADGTSTLGLVLSEVEGDLEGAAQGTPEMILAPLSRPAIVQMKDGVVVDSWLPEADAGVSLSLWRTIISALQLGANEADGAKWTGREFDTTGQAKVTYEWKKLPGSDNVTKQKTDYAQLLTPVLATTGVAQVKPKVVKSQGEYVVREGELEALDLKEVIEAPSLKGAALEATVLLTLKATKTKPSALLTAELVQKREEGRLHLPPQKPIPVLEKGAVGLFDKERMKGHSLDKLLSDFRAKATVQLSDRMDRHLALVSFLRADASAIPIAMKEVQRKTAAAHEVLSALGSAGTDEAQKALASVVADDKSFDEAMRERALISLTSASAPTDDTLRTMSDQLSDESIGNQAIYTLGVLSRKYRDAGDVGKVKLVRALLEQHLKEAKSEGEYRDAVGGIANSGDSYFIPVLSEASKNKDRVVRSLVAQALRHQLGEEGDRLMAEMLKSETHKHVQMTLLLVAKRRSPNKTLQEALTAFEKRTDLHDDVRKRSKAVRDQWQKFESL